MLEFNWNLRAKSFKKSYTLSVQPKIREPVFLFQPCYQGKHIPNRIICLLQSREGTCKLFHDGCELLIGMWVGARERTQWMKPFCRCEEPIESQVQFTPHPSNLSVPTDTEETLR